MPSISEMNFGFDSAGVEQYLEDIKSGALLNAKTAVEDTTDVVTILDNEWEGKARDNFKTNLTSDAKHISEQFDALYEILQTEISQVQAEMANKDEELIKI